MSAWRVGIEPPSLTRTLAGDNPVKSLINRIVKWIPGDVLALYGAALAAQMQSATPGPPDMTMVWVFVAATPLVVLLGALGTPGSQWQRVLVAMILSGIAFAIWSASLPNNGWMSQTWYPTGWQGPIYLALIGLLAGFLFDLVDEKVAGD